jgi:hypothetical protein
MVRQDLIAAIRNALERGESIEEAKSSLLNSGYNRDEVFLAAEELKNKEIKKQVPKPNFLPKLPEAPRLKR